VDADPITFIKQAEDYGADIIGASSLMTTTMPHQKEMIDILSDEGKRDKYKVVIGGAPTTVEWADEIGADLYAPDAGSAARLFIDLLKK
jgi:methanogenic corrinoid protein MtbC1